VIELFDTSALILAARDPRAGMALTDAVAGDELAVSEPILLEYLNGARNLAEYDRFADGFRGARVVTTDSADWGRALQIHRLLAASDPGHQRGVHLPDLIIAAAAERHGLPVVHYDEDFDRIAAVSGQRTRWVLPRGSV
jgi:predicted nucleic acid-binding protein